MANISLARVDPARINTVNLPGDVLADLQDAFSFYDKENNGYITMTHSEIFFITSVSID